jgi:hypothetical protein
MPSLAMSPLARSVVVVAMTGLIEMMISHKLGKKSDAESIPYSSVFH